MVQPLIFRKGLDLKDAVKGDLARDYHSDVVERIRTSDFRYDEGRLTIHLAREFGFCYGVDRAVDYAYQARKRFADQRVFLTGEIIHNPHVNEKLRTAGIRFLSDPGEPSPESGRGRRGDHPGLRRDGARTGAAPGTGLHARRHDLWVGPERVEERHPVCA